MHAIQMNKRQSYVLLSYNYQTPYQNIKKIVEDKVKFKEELIEKLQDDSNYDYVVGLKMDLDNLGSFFGRLNQTDVILEVGAKIEQFIIKTIDEFQKDTYQIFIGGDDIFILTKFSKMFTVSNLIQSKLRQAFKEIEHFGYIFSISSSAVIFKPKTPIIYYGEMLEQELGLAKTVKDAIVFEHNIFKWEQFKYMENYISLIYKKVTDQKQFSSKLNNIENTLKAIVINPDKASVIENFILKIPQFQERMHIVPQSLMQYKPAQKEEYLNEIHAFLICLKYLNRTINKGESYGY
jgi:CRISPR/Cas system-associated protein Cas10 (large subunit of type III CRISPR-Cas system)